MGAAASFEWIKCTPIEKSWMMSLEGTCWPQSVVIVYYMFTTGEFCRHFATAVPPEERC